MRGLRCRLGGIGGQGRLELLIGSGNLSTVIGVWHITMDADKGHSDQSLEPHPLPSSDGLLYHSEHTTTTTTNRRKDGNLEGMAKTFHTETLERENATTLVSLNQQQHEAAGDRHESMLVALDCEHRGALTIQTTFPMPTSTPWLSKTLFMTSFMTLTVTPTNLANDIASDVGEDLVKVCKNEHQFENQCVGFHLGSASARGTPNGIERVRVWHPLRSSRQDV